MKTSIIALAFFVMLSALTSCTKTIYTAQQNMSRYRTKQDIVNHFGLPTQKTSGDGTEEWIYNYGKVNRNKNADVNKSGQYKKYVKFTLDTNGNDKLVE